MEASDRSTRDDARDANLAQLTARFQVFDLGPDGAPRRHGFSRQRDRAAIGMGASEDWEEASRRLIIRALCPSPAGSRGARNGPDARKR